ncbi:MAG: NmrA family NAD(P)-binding protein [Chlamydiales bacterium]
MGSNTDSVKAMHQPILVTGAAGQVGAVGFKIVELLRAKAIPVRAMVRRFDDRSNALAQLGAEVVKGDLTDLQDVHRAIEGCRRLYFGMSVSSSYLEATVNVAAVAKHHGVELFLNISQMTVSQMSIFETTSSPQQKLHWLAEQVLNWSGLPIVHIRPTVFLENFFFYQWAAETIRANSELQLPFGNGRTSPISTQDIARVAVEILLNPTSHIGKIYELTGPKSQNLKEIAEEYSLALGRPIKYIDLPIEEWSDHYLKSKELPEHVSHHLHTMAMLHRENRYDRLVPSVEEITGIKPMGIREWVQNHIADFS